MKEVTKLLFVFFFVVVLLPLERLCSTDVLYIFMETHTVAFVIRSNPY